MPVSSGILVNWQHDPGVSVTAPKRPPHRPNVHPVLVAMERVTVEPAARLYKMANDWAAQSIS